MTHLEMEWRSPVWRHWIEFFASHFRFVRYDERGCGMSDWEVGDLGQERWADDLEAVAEAAGCSEPIVLLGISQGGAPAIEFAVRHPERVSHLVLYGCYSQGWMKRGDEGDRRRYEAMIELIEHGWGRSNPVFRQLFTSRFIPGGTDEQLNWFNELCLKTTSAKNAARLLEARAHVDVRRQLGDVRVPTLVLHARDDDVIPLSSGKILASEIPGAEFVELDSANHILLEDEPAWRRFREAVLDFTGAAAAEQATAEPAFAALSPREREVLGLITEGARECRDRRTAADQRQDGSQSRLQPVRQARRLDARAGDRLRARPRLPLAIGFNVKRGAIFSSPTDFTRGLPPQPSPTLSSKATAIDLRI